MPPFQVPPFARPAPIVPSSPGMPALPAIPAQAQAAMQMAQNLTPANAVASAQGWANGQMPAPASFDSLGGRGDGGADLRARMAAFSPGPGAFMRGRTMPDF